MEPLIAPEPPGLPFLGHLVPLLRDPLAFVERLHREHGPFARFHVGPDRYLMVTAPDALRHVFVDEAERYRKGAGWDGVRLVLRTGLLTSEGDRWRTRRRLAQPAFSPDRLAGYVGAIDDAIGEAHARWHGEIDLYAEVTRLTIDVVSRTVLGSPLAHRAEEVRDALAVVVAFAWSYGNEPVRLPLGLPTPGRARFRRALARLRAVADEAVAAGASEDLVGLLLAGRGEDLDDDGVRDEVLTQLLAGHETTATALVFAISRLLADPAWTARVRAEGEALPESVRMADVHALASSGAVVYEALRLWPPVWFLERRAVEDDVVCGHPVRAGTMVGASPWAIHRDPASWPDPEEFRPERFAGGMPARDDRFRWLPFSLGPRTCIGLRLAVAEAQLVLARTLARFELVPTTPAPTPVAGLTLRPSAGYRVRVVPR